MLTLDIVRFKTKMEERQGVAGKSPIFWITAVLISLSALDYSCGQQWGDFRTLKMCENVVNTNNNVILTDDNENEQILHMEECVCRVRKRVQANITFVNNKFMCDDRDSWKLEFYVDGCVEATYPCDIQTDTSGTYSIGSSSSIDEIYVKMARGSGSSTGSFYNIRISAVAADTTTDGNRIIETNCGLALDAIPVERCGALPPGQRTTTSTTVTGKASKQESKDGILEKPAILGAIIGGGVALLILLIVVCCLCARRCSKKPSRKYDDDQSEYSYARSIPGSLSKEMTHTPGSTVDTRQEKARRKYEKRQQRQSSKQRASKKPVYDSHIAPNSYDNNAYSSGTQNSLPDFIPPPPPPPQSNSPLPERPQPNGHSSGAEYARSTKKAVDKRDRKGKKPSKREIAVLDGGSVPYGYYDKVVDSEFGFMDDEMYGGEKGHY